MGVGEWAGWCKRHASPPLCGTRTVFFFCICSHSLTLFAPNLIFPCGVGVRHTGHPQRARCGEEGANQGRDEGCVSVNGLLVRPRPSPANSRYSCTCFPFHMQRDKPRPRLTIPVQTAAPALAGLMA